MTILAISMILSVISLGISYSVRQKAKTAFELKAHSRAAFKSYSALNQVLFQIATSTFTPSGLSLFSGGKENGEFWNLWGDPIEIEPGVTVSLRDGAGLVIPAKQPQIFQELLKRNVGDGVGTTAVDRLADWQDKDDFVRQYGAESWSYKSAGLDYGPRNFFMQTNQELIFALNLDTEQYNRIAGDLISWGNGSSNYLTMSENLLNTLIDDEGKVKELLRIRKNGKMTDREFRVISRVPLTEKNYSIPSGWIAIDVRVENEKTKDSIRAVIAKYQNFERPFQMIEWIQ